MPPPERRSPSGSVRPHQHAVVQHPDGQLVVLGVRRSTSHSNLPAHAAAVHRRVSHRRRDAAPRAAPPTTAPAPPAPPAPAGAPRPRRHELRPARRVTARFTADVRAPGGLVHGRGDLGLGIARRSSSGAPAPRSRRASRRAPRACGRCPPRSAQGSWLSDTALPPSSSSGSRCSTVCQLGRARTVGTPVTLGASALPTHVSEETTDERATPARRHRPRLHPARRGRQRGLPRRPQGPQGHRLLLPGRPDPRLHQAGLRLHRQPRPPRRRRLRRHRHLPRQAGEARRSSARRRP